MVVISIIIPIYNAEKYLSECLDSALEQDVEDKEIICIDDGSTDGSMDIIKKYSAKHSEIIVKHINSNQGAGNARNIGLKIAKGKYVCFLDADDFFIDRTAIRNMIEACKKNNVKVAGGLRQLFLVEDGGFKYFELHRDFCREHPDGGVIEYIDYQDDYHYTNYIYQREMLQQNSVYFPSYRRYQDPPFFLKAMLCAQRFWVSPIEFYCVRLGHQNFEEHGKKIVETLKGIRDNARVANDNNLETLQERLVDRLNNDFYGYIKENLDKTVVKLLMDIESCLLDKSLKINALEELKNYSDYYEIADSFFVLRTLLDANNKGIKLANIIIRKFGASNVAIYGLGWFGNLFYQELKGTAVEVVCGIDKSVESFFELPIYENVEYFKENMTCDMVIVSPIKHQGKLVENISKKTIMKTIGGVELVNEVYKELIGGEEIV